VIDNQKYYGGNDCYEQTIEVQTANNGFAQQVRQETSYDGTHNTEENIPGQVSVFPVEDLTTYKAHYETN